MPFSGPPPSGPGRILVHALPHDEASKEEYIRSSNFQLTAWGAIALFLLVGGALIGLASLRTYYWYVGPVLIVLGLAAFFLQPRKSG